MSEQPIQVQGLPKLLKKFGDRFGAKEGAARLLDSWRFATEREAKARMGSGDSRWLWKGSSRRSITSAREDRDGWPVRALVGSNLAVTRFGEYGTGRLSEDPDSSRRPYFPPPDKLAGWAKAHGNANPFLVARAIFRAGGTKPRRFLRGAAEDTANDLPRWLTELAKDIEANAHRGGGE